MLILDVQAATGIASFTSVFSTDNFQSPKLVHAVGKFRAGLYSGLPISSVVWRGSDESAANHSHIKCNGNKELSTAQARLVIDAVRSSTCGGRVVAQWFRPAESGISNAACGSNRAMSDLCAQFKSVFDTSALSHDWAHKVDLYSHCTGAAPPRTHFVDASCMC